MGTPPEPTPGPETELAGRAGRAEALRRARLRARARIRYLEARRQQAPVAPRAAARLQDLHTEEASLWRALRRVGREEVPPEAGGG
jgi:hypothetical protein